MGTEIFPEVNAPILQIRLRAPTGMRIEQTEPLVLKAEEIIKQTIGPDKVAITSDYVGTQPSSYPVDLIYLFTAGPQEAAVRVGLKQDVPGTEAMKERIRQALHQSLPQLKVSFEAADIISQVMSFGSPTPVNVAVQGASLEDDYSFAQKVMRQLHSLPFLRDLQFAQTMDYPTVHAEIDRDRAGQFGLTMANIANSFESAARFLTLHQSELLARSKVGQCVPNSGPVSATSDAEYRAVSFDTRHEARPIAAVPGLT